MTLTDFITPELHRLRAAFQAKNLDIRFVGGCVRDSLMGIKPKDVDLATDATPDEAHGIYWSLRGVTHYPTGLDHGTWTVKLADDQLYEITTLRTEAEHDGRYAKMTWTRDWIEDLSRRDLTINAMAMTFDGEVIDPFGGQEDLANRRVRFVGNAEERMREDYLRILRFFRFHGRIAGSNKLDEEAIEAIKRCKDGLRGISRERVWSEVSRIISGPEGATIFIIMSILVDWANIDAPVINDRDRRNMLAAREFTNDPVTCLAALTMNSDIMALLAEKWKWSASERDQGITIARILLDGPNLDDAKRDLAICRGNRQWWRQTFLAVGNVKDAEAINEWEIPIFPIQGRDLLAIGMEPGPDVGKTIKKLMTVWTSNDYQIDVETTLKELAEQL